MKIRTLFQKVRWHVTAIRHRDPLEPRLFVKLFGAARRRRWDPTRVPRRVLIVRSDEIGDTVSTVVLLGAMRATWPQAHLHVAVKPGPAAVFHATPTIDRLIPWTPIVEGSALKRQVLTAVQAWRLFGMRGYDLAVLPRWDFDDTPSRYLAAASRARSVVAFAPVPEREPEWFLDQRPLMTDLIARGDDPLLTVQQLERVANRLGLTWTRQSTPPFGRGLFDAADAARVDRRTARPTPATVTVGVGIGARDAKRQWPVDEIAAALGAVAETRTLAVRILGGPVDRDRATQLHALLRERDIEVVDLAGELSLSESAAAIAGCHVFLGNDSGLQHIASSLDVPTAVVTCHPASGSPWSDNAPERFGPWASRSIVLQPAHPADGCGDECAATEPHCIRAVTAPEVTAALESLLSPAR